MNIVLLDTAQAQNQIWTISETRQLEHLKKHLNIQIGDLLKVGILNGKRYLTEIVGISDQSVQVKSLQEDLVPAKLPVTLIVAMPRPKVLRRLIMDSVTLGVDNIMIIHSYRVDKSYWQSPLLHCIDEYVTLGLEQAGDTIAPKIEMFKRFKPFVEDILPRLISPEKPAFVAHPYAEQKMPQMIEQACSIIVGPEGGFIDYEIDLLVKNGCQAKNLGNRIIRTESVIPYVLGRVLSI